MNTAKGIYALIKFGNENHMEELINDGIIFLRRLKAYSCIEDSARADIYEGASEVFQPRDVVFTVNGRRIKDFAGPVSRVGDKNPFIYCMYAVTQKMSLGKNYHIDKKCMGLGNTAVIVTDIKAFYEKLTLAVMERRFYLHCDRVEYVSWENYSGVMGPFRKFDDLSHQHEWRIALGTSMCDETLKLELGSLRDISMIIRTEELSHGIRFITQ